MQKNIASILLSLQKFPNEDTYNHTVDSSVTDLLLSVKKLCKLSWCHTKVGMLLCILKEDLQQLIDDSKDTLIFVKNPLFSIKQPNLAI